MPKPLKDVDMVVVLAEIYRQRWFGSGRGGPVAAMAAIREIIAARWPDARFDVDKQPAHALQVTFLTAPSRRAVPHRGSHRDHH